jgi:lysophospholipase L1-like esterase
MTTILCYGDSNTWGYVPTENRRYNYHERWTGVMADALGDAYTVIEEGLPGRTTVHSDPIEGAHKNGLMVLPAILESHVPLDMVIILLGTNDLKKRFSLSPFDIAEGAGILVHMIKQGTWGIVPKILLVCPPPLGKLSGGTAQMAEGGVEKSHMLPEQFARVSRELDVPWFNAGDVVVTSDRDGVHWEAPEHHKLGLALADVVRGMFE